MFTRASAPLSHLHRSRMGLQNDFIALETLICVSVATCTGTCLNITVSCIISLVRWTQKCSMPDLFPQPFAARRAKPCADYKAQR